ncbi:MAG: diguanylate cyclase [Chitinispirillales bacterium]|nr:diguanylate cyclase [Chitinispirillales bacterium]
MNTNSAIDGKKNKILIVDDDEFNTMTLDHILRPTYEILTANDGKSGLRIARESVPDLILLDIIMSSMSGFEVIAELKREDALSRIPVIFITSLNAAKDEEKGLALGAADYITKPFNISIVKARVNTYIQMMKYIRTIELFGKTDTLTGLTNRRGFDERVKVEWSRAIREKEPLSVLMIDADKFKVYNDTYGHMQGDILLKAMGGIFSKTVKRTSDLVSRWGGEEFSILLPNTDLEAATAIAEQIRANVEKAVVPLPDGTPTRITISIGVNSMVPAIGNAINDFLIDADNFLYAAKEAGRNRVASELKK